MVVTSLWRRELLSDFTLAGLSLSPPPCSGRGVVGGLSPGMEFEDIDGTELTLSFSPILYDGVEVCLHASTWGEDVRLAERALS